jgi:hypothetical protein
MVQAQMLHWLILCQSMLLVPIEGWWQKHT